MYNNSSNWFNDYYYQDWSNNTDYKDWSNNNTDYYYYYEPQPIIEKINIKPKERKLKGKWTLELERELELSFGVENNRAIIASIKKLFGINEKQKKKEFIKENEFKL